MLKTDVNDDSATIDDAISFKVFIRLTDGARGESVTVADQVAAFTKLDTLRDSATVEDAIEKSLKKDVNDDSVTIEDSISFKVFIR